MMTFLGAVTAMTTVPAGGVAASLAAGDDLVIQNYSATVRVNTDGSLHVSEAVTYDFAGEPTSKVDRTIVTRESYDADDDRVYRLSDVAVDAVQVDVDADITTADTQAVISVAFSEPEADQATVTFEYDVTGAVAQTADGLEVRWPVVQGFDAPIDRATVQWNAPGVVWLSCLAGPSGSSRPCTTSQLVDVAAPTMTQQGIGAGDQMVGILGLTFDSGVSASTDLQARRTLARSFTAEGAPLQISLAVLALGLLFALALYWLRGRDSKPTSGAGSTTCDRSWRKAHVLSAERGAARADGNARR